MWILDCDHRQAALYIGSHILLHTFFFYCYNILLTKIEIMILDTDEHDHLSAIKKK